MKENKTYINKLETVKSWSLTENFLKIKVYQIASKMFPKRMKIFKHFKNIIFDQKSLKSIYFRMHKNSLKKYK